MGWYEAVRDIATVIDKLNDAELKHHLAAVRMEGALLVEENARLLQDLADLREQARIRQTVVYRDNVYWHRDGEAATEGPFCPRCLNGSDKAARMKDSSDRWTCHLCKCDVEKPGVQRQIRVDSSCDPFPD